MKKIEKQTGQTPQALRDAPSLDDDQVPFWNAYQRLSSSRQFSQGGGGGYIPLTEVAAFISIFGPEGCVDAEEFVRFVRSLDSVYCEISSKKAQQAAENRKKEAAKQSKGKRR